MGLIPSPVGTFSVAAVFPPGFAPSSSYRSDRALPRRLSNLSGFLHCASLSAIRDRAAVRLNNLPFLAFLPMAGLRRQCTPPPLHTNLRFSPLVLSVAVSFNTEAFLIVENRVPRAPPPFQTFFSACPPLHILSCLIFLCSLVIEEGLRCVRLTFSERTFLFFFSYLFFPLRPQHFNPPKAHIFLGPVLILVPGSNCKPERPGIAALFLLPLF